MNKLLISLGVKPRRGKVKKCLICDKEFYRKPSQVEKGFYCSYKCYGIGQMNRSVLKCVICNKEYSRPKSQIKWRGSSCCSNKCKWELIKSKKDNNSYSWKGNKATYSPIHAWVRKNKGNPEKCFLCNKIGERIKGKWNIQWANIDHKYKRNLNDYIGLCKKCHIENDKKI